MVTRVFVILIVFAIVGVACSSFDGRPVEFEGMTLSEVGCTVEYGDTVPYVLGPLGPSDVAAFKPNDYTSFRIGRTESTVVIVTERPRSASTGLTHLDDIPFEGIVVTGPFIDGGSPGWAITCWRGEG